MSLWKIAWRSMQWRGLSSALTALSMALGVALIVAVLVMYGVLSRSFAKGAQGFDLIVGAKGGRLQLVLNTVYHLSTPIENIPWTYYKEFRPGGKYASEVSAAIPYCLGDNFEGYRVVGTTAELFQIEYVPGEHYQFASGRNFESDHYFEAVIGSQVAYFTGLRVGSKFEPTHGVSDDGQGHKHDAFRVVGILDPTGTPNDRALFVNIEGFFLLAGHAKEAPGESHAAHEHAHDHDHADSHEHHHEPLPENQREVTAILVRTASPLVMLSLPRRINKEPFAQAVMPAREIYALFEGILGNLRTVLLVLAVVVVVVASVGVMVSIYNSMSDRRREVAIMRSLGAGRRTVLVIVLLEATLLALGGGLLGLAMGHGLIGALNPLIEAETGVSIGPWEFPMYDARIGDVLELRVPLELVLIPGLILAAIVAGLLPAVAAYRTDVAKTLSG
ncbi:MAG TPA: FtsX-like permease family protein [Pirellulales bacterium]|jgi:putative ABC transport system permease protein|nr:FtsX-like permease family protein [Pirellulales bacterium]